MKNDSDTALIRMSQDGDARAFERLVERHYLTVYRVAYKWCGVKEDAEDVAQEVFVKLARALKGFRMEAAFGTWLHRITINAAKDWARRRAVRHPFESGVTDAGDVPGGGAAPDLQYRARRAFAAIDRLPEKQKAAVLLVLAEGLTHKEAAEVLGCSETTVSWRIFQARRKLKKLDL